MSFDSYTKQRRKSNKNYIAVLRIFRLLCKKFFFHSYIGLVRKRPRKTSNFYSHSIEFLKNCSYSIFLEHCIGSNYGGPPQIGIAIPRLKDVNPESKSWKSVELLTDVLLLVESNVEFISCYAFLCNVFKSRINELGLVYFGTRFIPLCLAQAESFFFRSPLMCPNPKLVDGSLKPFYHSALLI